MQRGFYARVVATILLVCGFLLAGGENVLASTQDELLYPWLGEKGVSIVSRSPIVKERLGCSSRTEAITFRGGYTTTACIYGDIEGTRVARYTNQGGLVVAGIAYPGEVKYSEIYGVCEGGTACAYSASRDVLIDSRTSRFYVGFAKRLVKMTNPINGEPYYQFSGADQTRYISASGPMAFNAAAVSVNGKWAVVEAYERGFVRVDLDTFHERRIVTTGTQYGVANDPRFEPAISNSGREFVYVGYGSGISMFQIDSYCGDVLNPQSANYLMNPSVPCRYVQYHTGQFPAFRSAHSPVFSDDGMRLGLTIQTTTTAERVIAAPAQNAPSVDSEMLYLALGDSYTSGEGETGNQYYKDGTDLATNKCHLSNRSYPYLVGGIQGIERTRSVACSGAQTKDIFGTDVYYGQKNQVTHDEIEKKALEYQTLADFIPGVVRQIDFVSKYQPKVISVGIGGNDAGMMDKLNACIGLGVCEWAKDPALRLSSAKEIQRLYETIRSTIAALRTASPNTKIAFIGYPRIINEDITARCSLVLGAMISPEERQFMDESIKVLNDTVKAAALSEGSKFIDIQDAFVGHRLCEGDAKAMNGLRGGDDIAPLQNLSSLKLIGAESFHPTPYGHMLVANRIQSLESQLLGMDLADATEVSPSAVSSYWTNEVDESQTRRLKRETVAPQEVRPGQQVPITVLARRFRSLSTVMVEIHSDVKKLGEMAIDSAGGGVQEVSIPYDAKSGYHTLHLLGESWAGELLDIYQIIKVVGEEDEILPAGISDNGLESGDVSLTSRAETTHTDIMPKIQPVTSASVITSLPTILGITNTRGGVNSFGRSVVQDDVKSDGKASHHNRSLSYVLLALIVGISILASIYIYLFYHQRVSPQSKS